MHARLCPTLPAIAFAAALAIPGRAQQPATPNASRSPAAAGPVAPVAQRVGQRSSELADVVQQYSLDRSALQRRYDAESSPDRRRRLRAFYGGWRERLREVDFGKLGQEGRVDYVLLDATLRAELAQLAQEDTIAAQVASMAPFTGAVAALHEGRRRLDPPDAPASARLLTQVARQVDSLRRQIEQQRPAPAAVPAGSAPRRDSVSTASAAGNGGGGRDTVRRAVADGVAHGGLESAANGSSAADTTLRPPPTDSVRMRQIVALRAVQQLESARATLEQWYRYYAGYDPTFTWWVARPHVQADSALRRYVRVMRERVLGMQPGEDEPIIGYPIGAAALRDELAAQFIAYSPEELLAIAEREFAWCEREMLKAAREMGFGENWRGALEKVKNSYVEPGKQPDLIRDLANEAIDFVERRQLVTVPPLAKEVWRMEMMTPEAQKVSPFFLGGEVIRVSYPTDAMTNEDKMMSMRGNNPHFSRATVHHELIPGHHLQQFMNARYNAHRQAFRTPFWTEGWALYWEMRLWDLGFPRTPEDRVGMLFWRTHRAARIIFSLRFHLGTMTPQQAIDFLVDRVGHERANATAEVRRSFNGSYPPLYQLAYMIGGLQFRALHEELVTRGRMSEREFHDAILQGGNMPVDLVRARLTRRELSRDYRASWRFSDAR